MQKKNEHQQNLNPYLNARLSSITKFKLYKSRYKNFSLHDDSMNILIKSSKLQLSRWEIDKISWSINSCRYVHPITMSTQITTKNEQTQADIRNIYSKTLALWPQFSSTSFKRVFLEFRKWNAKIANKCRSKSMYPILHFKLHAQLL